MHQNCFTRRISGDFWRAKMAKIDFSGKWALWSTFHKKRPFRAFPVGFENRNWSNSNFQPKLPPEHNFQHFHFQIFLHHILWAHTRSKSINFLPKFREKSAIFERRHKQIQQFSYIEWCTGGNLTRLVDWQHLKCSYSFAGAPNSKKCRKIAQIWTKLATAQIHE